MLRSRAAGRSWGAPQAAFTLLELLIVTVIVSILALIAVPFFREVLIKAHVNSVATDGRILFHGFEEWHSLYYQYPNSTSPPNFNLLTFEPMRSNGVYQGNMQARLLNGQADAYDSPDDQGANQEFWVQFTVRADPSYQIIVAHSDDAPLGGGAWLQGVYVFKDGVLIRGPGT